MASMSDDDQEARYLNSVAHRFRFSPGLIFQFANVPARQRRANNLANMMRLGKRATESTYEDSQPLLETYADSHPSTL
uniref:PolyA_pol_RNAbd domain-containing protein n=1 Tax=Panagrellus redivivus TaxID=6233 RepID=A0A7E4W7U3_PANRE